MRELILKMSISVDGFVSDLEGTNTWMYGSDEESRAWTAEGGRSRRPGVRSSM